MRNVLAAAVFLGASLAGGGANAAPISLMFEADTDVPNGFQELAILSYDSIDDVVTNNTTSTVFTNLGVAAGYSTTGITYDGSLYRVMFESDADIANGFQELAILSYASIADIVTNAAISTVFTNLGVAAGYSTTGIAFDGSLYHVMFESDVDIANGFQELAILSYASIADIVTNTAVSTMFTNLGVAAGYSTTGFNFDGSLYQVMFESDVDIANGFQELAILSYASIADIVTNTPVSTVFTNLGVAAGYSTTGLFSVVDFNGGGTPPPTPVPEPGTLGLLALGATALAGRMRRRTSSCISI